MNNEIRAVGIESLVNEAFRNQANSYITTNPDKATSIDANKITNGTIVIGQVLPPADSVRYRNIHPAEIVEPLQNILGEGTIQTSGQRLGLALWQWATVYSAVRYCRFEIDTNTGPIPPYFKYCYLPTFSDGMTVYGITPSYINAIGGFITGNDITYDEIVNVIQLLKAHLKNVHEDPTYGTLFQFCHSSCHSNCHGSRSRR